MAQANIPGWNSTFRAPRAPGFMSFQKTPEDWRIEPENGGVWFRWFSELPGVYLFSSSMLIFQGCNAQKGFNSIPISSARLLGGKSFPLSLLDNWLPQTTSTAAHKKNVIAYSFHDFHSNPKHHHTNKPSHPLFMRNTFHWLSCNSCEIHIHHISCFVH